ncbi:MAG: protocatechuate 3,4-dioxygenase beta subunit [Bacteroidia bacterium]|jgi:protocatechuate 3,4-dioxygenase beta subunit
MSSKSNDSRRKFLRNVSLTALSVGALAKVSGAKPVSTEGAGGCNPTTLDYYGEGPFYTNNPPTIVNNQLAEANEAGTRIIISGVVRTLDCSEIIPDTIVDVWHANDPGQYDNSGFNLRGKMLSNAQGFYMFETIYPGKYLNGPVFRPSHIHFKITPPGFSTITTQLYFEGDIDLTTDPASSITSGTYNASDRIIALTDNGQGVLEGTWDIIVDGDGTTTGMSEIHLNTGMIYEVAPNPYSDQVSIRYGVFNESKVALSVFDVNGKLIADLNEETLQPEKYEAVWQPDSSIPNGHYFIALKVNDMQVHYQKTILAR